MARKVATVEMVVVAPPSAFEEMKKVGIEMRPLTRVFGCIHCGASFGDRTELDGHLAASHEFMEPQPIDAPTRAEFDEQSRAVWQELDLISALTTEYEDLRRAYIEKLIELIPLNATVPIMDRIERLLFPEVRTR